MKCPSCKTAALLPTEVEHGLVGAGCESCTGVLLSLFQYRYWAENQRGPEVCGHDVDAVEAEDSKSAKICPKCSKLMTKYRIGLEQDNRVDLCAHCDEAWLDSGEWTLLKSLELHGDLANIFTDSWQRKIRKDREQKKWDEHFSRLIGEDDFAKVKIFKEWLDSHKSMPDIKHYLTTNFDK